MITVDYDEKPGSPTAIVMRGKIVVVRTLQCNWVDMFILARELVGWREGFVLYPPDKYDTGDDILGVIYAKEVAIEPIIGLDSDTGNYKYAKLTVNYSTREYEESEEGETYITESVQAATEFITLSRDNLFWDNTQTEALQADEVPSKIHRMLEWSYTRHHENSIPDAVFDKVGYINSSSIRSKALGYTFGAGTLLFGNPSCSRTTTSEGESDWEITYTFIYNEKGWNNFPHTSVVESGSVKYGPIYNDSGTQIKPYPSTSFSSLII